MTLEAKGKINLDKSNPLDVLISLTPKSMELKNLIVKKRDIEIKMEA